MDTRTKTIVSIAYPYNCDAAEKQGSQSEALRLLQNARAESKLDAFVCCVLTRMQQLCFPVAILRIVCAHASKQVQQSVHVNGRGHGRLDKMAKLLT